MVEQHLPLRATGLARALAVLVLLAGIVAMHAAVFAVHGHAEATVADHRAEAGSEPIGSTMQTRTGSDGATSSATPDDMPLNAIPVEHGIAGDGGRNLLAMPMPVTGPAAVPNSPAPDDTTWDTMPAGHGSAGTGGRYLLGMPTTVIRPALPPDANHGVPGPDCAGDGCGGTHGGMHGCVFILAAAALLLALVLLYRLGVARPGNAVARLRHRRPRRERSPPWTVLSLAELSILRI